MATWLRSILICLTWLIPTSLRTSKKRRENKDEPDDLHCADVLRSITVNIWMLKGRRSAEAHPPTHKHQLLPVRFTDKEHTVSYVLHPTRVEMRVFFLSIFACKSQQDALATYSSCAVSLAICGPVVRFTTSGRRAPNGYSRGTGEQCCCCVAAWGPRMVGFTPPTSGVGTFNAHGPAGLHSRWPCHVAFLLYLIQCVHPSSTLLRIANYV